ncbi:MAG TPA: hypothetical protein IAB90_06980 [Candidatus Coproplasma stercoripullorum]|uniref:Uncharacterized protein n=1 Tax=Candidatus Coproplasma stercoripullorum TaxID=2840751 RepID=A0A9D1AHE7_9FIRM|nr:hypothetical protein [Candidatus Coproplasma stercoripullorum]
MDFKKKPKISTSARILVALFWIVAVAVFAAAVLSFFIDVPIPEEAESYGYSTVATEEVWHS